VMNGECKKYDENGELVYNSIYKDDEKNWFLFLILFFLKK
jgi:antitoxin component YwqK of YwqJK toxin-antitoxin module